MYFIRRIIIIMALFSLAIITVPDGQAEEEIPEAAPSNLIVPDISDGEKISYVVTFLDKEEKSFAIDGELAQLERFTYTTRLIEEEGKVFYEVKEREELSGDLYTEYETLFELGDYMRMLHYTQTVHSYTDKVVRRHYSDYDDALYDFPGPTILTHAITFWLRGIDFERGEDAEFYLMLLGDSSPPWRMHARLGMIEEITVPAGTFKCQKVTIDPDYKHFLGKWAWASFIIKPLVPDFFIWYSTKPPYPMVRFEGALGVKGITAVQIHELESYEAP